VGASAALVAAVVVSRSVPDTLQFFGADCGSVSDWASNQDSVCNTPLLNRACLVVALLAVAAVLVADALVEDAGHARSVRTINLAVWGAAPVVALIAVNAMFDDAGWPSTGFAIVVLAVTLAVLAVIPVSAAIPWRARGPVLAIAVVGSAVLFAYAQVLWAGNGA
jgi:hypothetical protein